MYTLHTAMEILLLKLSAPAEATATVDYIEKLILCSHNDLVMCISGTLVLQGYPNSILLRVISCKQYIIAIYIWLRV